jgi:hypothetical protein
MEPIRQRDRVPAEFLGRSRVFRWEVTKASDHFKAQFLSLAMPIMRRFEKHKTLRRATELDAIKQWTRMSIPYRFSLNHGKDEDGCLWIEEVRLDSLTLPYKEWDSPEAGICISRMRLTTNDSTMRFQGTPFVILSFHALARYAERSGSKDMSASLMQDLQPLLDCSDVGERVHTTAGAWVGDTKLLATNSLDRRFDVRTIRTYVTRQPAGFTRSERRALWPGRTQLVPSQQTEAATS